MQQARTESASWIFIDSKARKGYCDHLICSPAQYKPQELLRLCIVMVQPVFPGVTSLLHGPVLRWVQPWVSSSIPAPELQLGSCQFKLKGPLLFVNITACEKRWQNWALCHIVQLFNCYCHVLCKIYQQLHITRVNVNICNSAVFPFPANSERPFEF